MFHRLMNFRRFAWPSTTAPEFARHYADQELPGPNAAKLVTPRTGAGR
jgi:hypothetical protein